MGNCFTSGTDTANPLEGRARHYVASDTVLEARSEIAEAPLPTGVIAADRRAAGSLEESSSAGPVPSPPRRRVRINSNASSLTREGTGPIAQPLERNSTTATTATTSTTLAGRSPEGKPPLPAAPRLEPLTRTAAPQTQTGPSLGVLVTPEPEACPTVDRAVESLEQDEWVAIHEEFADDPDEVLEQFQRNVGSHSGLSSPCASSKPQAQLGGGTAERLRMSPPDGLTQTDSADAGSYVSTWLDDQLVVRVRRDSPPASVTDSTLSANKITGPYHVASIRCLSASVCPGHGEASQSQTQLQPLPQPQLKSPRPQPRKSPRHSRDSGSSSSSAAPLRLHTCTVSKTPAPLSTQRTWDIAAAVVESQLQE